jgi:Holliday junction resolvase-like predicted endonuclease
MLTYDVMVGEKEHIQMKVAKDMVHVEVKGRSTKFEVSVGVMGTHPHKGHGRVARDGQTVIHDLNELCQEWQVRGEDSRLFQVAKGPQFPTQCTPPSDAHASNQRRLRQGSADEKALSEIAHAASAHLVNNHSMHNNCIFDVMATVDAEVAAMAYGGVW